METPSIIRPVSRHGTPYTGCPMCPMALPRVHAPGASLVMPSAPMRPCAGGCGRHVTRGRCPDCARAQEKRRGSASVRGYGTAWQAFRPRYIALLVQQDILPICGAALPTGPQTQDSRCKAEGRLTFEDLHLDHEPPLTEAERQHVHIVCDPNRIQLLCGPRCHHDKTNRQRQTREGGVC